MADKEEFDRVMENERGFILAAHCGEDSCEPHIKEQTGATIRCLPSRPSRCPTVRLLRSACPTVGLFRQSLLTWREWRSELEMGNWIAVIRRRGPNGCSCGNSGL